MCSCAHILALDWKERAFIEKVNSICPCWFPAAIFVYQNCPQFNMASPYKALQSVMLKRRPCRLQTVQTVQTVQTECYFFYLYLNFLVIKNFYYSFPQERARWRKVSCFLFVTVSYCHNYLVFFFGRRSFFRLSTYNKTLFAFLQRLRERLFLNFLDCWWS